MLAEPAATLTVPPELPGDRARLLVIDGASSVVVELPAAGVVTIGRAPDCELRLSDTACSRRHAQLHIDGGGLTLEDLGSHNGTRVNGERLTGRHPVTSDDVIGIGPIRLVVQSARAPGGDAAFRPINDELRELERRRMREALVAAGGVQKKAAKLIGMPLRTFTLKYKQYGFGER
jgi:pSer/pThr/pTyr-binding forkhead associated (FHA) protein